MAKILSELPAQITAGMQLVSFTRKTTEKQPVAEDMKFRCVEIPAYSFTVVAEPTEAQDAFSEAISTVVSETASDLLKAYCIENSKDGKYPDEIPDDSLSFNAVLQRMSESQTSERLNGEQIAAWYDASETKKEAEKRYTDSEKGKRQQAAMRAKVIATASNNPGIDAALALKMIGYISEQDLASPVCRAVVKKLERLSKAKVDADEL